MIHGVPPPSTGSTGRASSSASSADSTKAQTVSSTMSQKSVGDSVTGAGTAEAGSTGRNSGNSA